MKKVIMFLVFLTSTSLFADCSSIFIEANIRLNEANKLYTEFVLLDKKLDNIPRDSRFNDEEICEVLSQMIPKSVQMLARYQVAADLFYDAWGACPSPHDGKAKEVRVNIIKNIEELSEYQRSLLEDEENLSCFIYKRN